MWNVIKPQGGGHKETHEYGVITPTMTHSTAAAAACSVSISPQLPLHIPA